MIRFEFSDLHTDRPRLEDAIDAILGVVGLFELRVDGRLLYLEHDFPLIEFVRALNSWLEGVVDSGQDFEYESMDAAEPGLVWIRRDDDRWRIGSIFQEYPEVKTFSLEEIQMSANDLTKRLTEEARAQLGLDLANLLESPRRMTLLVNFPLLRPMRNAAVRFLIALVAAGTGALFLALLVGPVHSCEVHLEDGSPMTCLSLIGLRLELWWGVLLRNIVFLVTFPLIWMFVWRRLRPRAPSPSI